jgi:hypothetical protein
MTVGKEIFATILCLLIGSCLLSCSAVPEADRQAQPVQPAAQAVSKASDAKAVERSIYVSIPDVFKQLERPPVLFNHDKHTKALESEGCESCHPKDPEDAFLFTFPKVRNEKNAETLMNSFHDECIGCHRKRTAEDKKAGPTACGECHRAQPSSGREKYTSILPEYYNVDKDAYHSDCLACHREPPVELSEATPLDWKSFYVKEQKLVADAWPKMVSDYYVHDKHNEGLDKKCDPCHYISPERRSQLAAEGREPKNVDWLLDIDEANSLTDQKKVHVRCLNCHLKRKAEDKKGGPFVCNGCHTDVQRTIEEMEKIPRSDCEQEDVYLIELKKDARAKSVPFNHKSHEKNSRSCQDCHHETLRPCGECHTPEGSKEGDGITLAEAHHALSSTWSCVGCHETVKRERECAGCHSRMDDGMVASDCTTCHSGDVKSLEAELRLPAPKTLLPDDVKDEIEIGVMEKLYKPSKMPHLAISRKLTELSNQSPLASYFHRSETTICAGCHHRAPLERKVKVPQCRTCHENRQQAEGAIPVLLGAFHQQCLTCHKQMVETEKKLPQDCKGCHEEKKKDEGVKNVR